MKTAIHPLGEVVNLAGVIQTPEGQRLVPVIETHLAGLYWDAHASKVYITLPSGDRGIELYMLEETDVTTALDLIEGECAPLSEEVAQAIAAVTGARANFAIKQMVHIGDMTGELGGVDSTVNGPLESMTASLEAISAAISDIAEGFGQQIDPDELGLMLEDAPHIGKASTAQQAVAAA